VGVRKYGLGVCYLLYIESFYYMYWFD
jgi:hypothetical protein